MTDDQFRNVCNIYGFAPSRALRELVEIVISQAVISEREACAKAVISEREACAKVADSLGVHPALNVYNGGPDWYKHGKEIAAAIRARDKKEPRQA